MLLFFLFLSCSLLQPISSTWYDYWGADYGSYSYNPYTGGVGIPVSKPPVAATAEKPGSQNLSVSVSQGERCQKKYINDIKNIINLSAIKPLYLFQHWMLDWRWD